MVSNYIHDLLNYFYSNGHVVYGLQALETKPTSLSSIHTIELLNLIFPLGELVWPEPSIKGRKLK
jgi:hypothetical protein